MMPASNNGLGMNMGFPDVCLTPAAPAPVPIPYPNLAMNTMATPFSPNVFVGFMPSLNMGAKIPMTSGDDAGVANPLFKQMGQYTMGNPHIFVNNMPAVNMLVPTSGNMMNNPVGAALVPSITTTLYTYAPDGSDRCSPSQRLPIPRRARAGVTLDAPTVSYLRCAVAGEPSPGASRRAGPPLSRAPIGAESLGHATALLRIERFVRNAPTLVHAAMARLGPGPLRALILDLRGNPGGDAEAALELADDFLPQGALLGYRCDGDDDTAAIRARHRQSYPQDVVVLVDGATASAAELFAGCLQAHGRARLLGERTFGKGSAQRIIPSSDGGASYATVASFRLPNGAPLEGRGLEPDEHVDPRQDGALERARQVLAGGKS